MATSLLAHLYTHIRGSQEDIATLSLQYILSQSDALNRAFTKRIATNLNIELCNNIHYITQAVGQNKERPDLAGIGANGKELVLCEMKFYAGLTSNQPLAYLDRLRDGGGKGLLFICPNARQTSLWTKLKEACSHLGYKKIDDYCICVDGINMAITSWAEILELLSKTASSVAVELLADIKQLEGYCSQMDSEAFIPFSPEELSAENAKRSERFYDVIDETINLLCDDNNVETSLKGLKASAYRNGYTRSLYIDEFTISLNFDRYLWKNTGSAETPFWIAVRDADWDQPEDFLVKASSIQSTKRDSNQWGLVFLALEPLCNATLPEVCADMKRQILDYLSLFRAE